MNRIITISREFGSGGRELGRRLSERLGAAYYDREIITEISKRTALAEQYIEGIIEQRPVHSFPIQIGHSFSYPLADAALQQRQAVLAQQHQVIREMAQKSDCVIVGRCADYILRESHPFRVFVYADMASKIRRCREKAPSDEKMSDQELEHRIISMDKNRAKYYRYYTDLTWGRPLNYDLCLNTSRIQIKAVLPAVEKMFAAFLEE